MVANDLADRIAALPPEKRALLEQLLAQRSKPGVHELSVTQQGLWFLDRLVPGSSLYNVAWRCRLGGPVDVSVLGAAFSDVVARHEVLRTRFDLVDGRPMQLVAPQLDIRVAVQDLRHIDEADREREIDARVQAAVEVGFDLSQGPLVRATLLRVADEEHVLITEAHHIVFDFVSTDILLRELSACYEARLAGRTPDLPALSIQYGDFAAWQQQHLRGAELERLLRYWRLRLGEAAGMLDLPSDRPRPARQSFAGGSYRVALAPAAVDGLRRLAQQERCTPFMAYAGAYAALLHRYTGVTDLCIGVAVDNRNRAELRPLIGYFINAVVLRMELSGDPSFVRLLRRVRQVCFDAYDHQELPFDRLVEALAPQRSLSHNPFFQVTCALDEQPTLVEPATGQGLRFLRVDGVHTGRAKFDLSFTGEQTDDGITIAVDYSRDLFDEDTIAAMTRHFERLVLCAAEHPQLPLSRLALLDEAETALVTAGRPWAQVPDPAEDQPHAVLATILDQAVRTPHAPALVSDDDTAVSYQDLIGRATAIAQSLRDRGIGPEQRVRMPRSLSVDWVVTMLASQLTGAVSVPAAAASPADASPADATPAGGPVEAEFVPAVARLDQAAAVVVTAGTTGPAAAVVLTHAVLAEAVALVTGRLRAQDRVLAVGDEADATSLWLTLATLTAGATLVLGGGEVSPAGIDQTIRRQRVSVAVLPAPTLRRVDTTAPTLRLLLATTEPSIPDGSGVATVEVFGAAETAGVLALGLPAAPRSENRSENRRESGNGNVRGNVKGNPNGDTEGDQVAGGDGAVVLGRLGPRSRVYVLDEQMQPVPIGVPGELYLGGPLARGYADRPGLTAQRFVPDPFGAEPGGRLWRSGDVARWRRDGELVYLGRRAPDALAFRADTARAEAVARDYPGVRDAVVVAEPGGRPRAYVTTTGEVEPRRLQAFLAGRLPDTLMPATVTVLAELPATARGHLDRAALPRPAGTSGRSQYAPPTTAVERVLVSVFAQLLGEARLGVDDSFFDLGGHSLLAAQLLADVGELFGLVLPLRTLFSAATPAALAVELGDAMGGAEEAEAAAVAVERVLAMTEDEVREQLSQAEADTEAQPVGAARMERTTA